MNLTNKSYKELCPKCKSENTLAISYCDTVDFRGMEFDVEDLKESKCNDCNYKWVTSPQLRYNQASIRSAYGVLRDKLRQEQGLLSGDEIAWIRERFSLNQREAAVVFGGGYNAFNKYESGEVLQSLAMDRLLRLTNTFGYPALRALNNIQQKTSPVAIKSNVRDSFPYKIQIKSARDVAIDLRSGMHSSHYLCFDLKNHTVLNELKQLSPPQPFLATSKPTKLKVLSYSQVKES